MCVQENKEKEDQLHELLLVPVFEAQLFVCQACPSSAVTVSVTNQREPSSNHVLLTHAYPEGDTHFEQRIEDTPSDDRIRLTVECEEAPRHGEESLVVDFEDEQYDDNSQAAQRDHRICEYWI